MAKVKRKSRKKLIKQVDISKPIPLGIIGTKDDPCFGLHYDPQAKECQRCGDSEICAIALGQRNHIARAQVESTQSFKDLEEEQIKPAVDKVAIRRSIKNRIRKMIKMGGSDGVLITMIVDDIYASYSKDGYSKGRIRRLINRMLEKTDRFKQKLNLLIWKSHR